MRVLRRISRKLKKVPRLHKRSGDLESKLAATSNDFENVVAVPPTANAELRYTGWPLQVVGPRSSAETLGDLCSQGTLSVSDAIIPVSWHDVDVEVVDDASFMTGDSHETAVDDGLGDWGLPKILEEPSAADDEYLADQGQVDSRLEVDTVVASLDIPLQTPETSAKARVVSSAQQLQRDTIKAVYMSLLVRRNAGAASKMAERVRARTIAEPELEPAVPASSSWSASTFIGGLLWG
jgi:hypothetical protein